MKKEINLEELFNNNFDCYTTEIIDWKEVEAPALSKNKFKELCLNFGEHLLELAAKNANIEEVFVEYMADKGDENPYENIVNKQSILDTIKKIE